MDVTREGQVCVKRKIDGTAEQCDADTQHDGELGGGADEAGWRRRDAGSHEECGRNNWYEEAGPPHAAAVLCTPGCVEQEVADTQRETGHEERPIVSPPIQCTDGHPDDEWCIPDEAATARHK